MKKLLILLLLLNSLLLCQNSKYNDNEHYLIPSIDKTLLFGSLGTSDLTIPLDTTDYANTNQSRQIIPIVYKLMTEPLYSLWFLDTLMAYRELDLTGIIYQLFKDINFYNTEKFSYVQHDLNTDNLLKTIIDKLSQSYQNRNELLSVYSETDKKYLVSNISYLYEIMEGDDNNKDVFKYSIEQDSAIKKSKRILDLLSILDKSQIFQYSMNDYLFCYNLFEKINQNADAFDNNKDIIYETITDGFHIIIGGTNTNSYKGEYDFIIDLGGNDVYELTKKDHNNDNLNCIIDINGDDVYSTKDKFSAAGSLFTSSFIFDEKGNDVYRLGSSNLASAIGGLAVLYDGKGNDVYEGNDFSTAAGLFGCGLLYDKEGNDIYSANTFSQGFGMTSGVGALVDLKGNDSYVINPKYIHVYLYSDHYLSMCQGYGYGLRPYYAGGLGYIIEGEGNDVYACDIFGQGGSYWYSLGCIVDRSGHDKYNGFHYNQGSGIHFSVGLLKDYEGWDYYTSNWVSQGCGHDYAVGLLWDVKGNDIYGCEGLSQGAGNANGIGILIDEYGKDGYLSKDLNTQGYGSPGRGFGSIGMLMDLSGTDSYSRISDSFLTKYSEWGVKLDDINQELTPVVFNEEMKIDVDSSRQFSIEELYTMARILEVKYSNHSQFAFRKLVNDSTAAAGYLLSKVSSEDISDIVLIRNLIPQIGFTMSNIFAERLQKYINNKVQLSQDEIIFMIFLIGESKNSNTKEILFSLLNDERYRVRSAAVTALSKFDYKENDKVFKAKFFEKIKEMINENSDYKLYNKDIALALKNFDTEITLPLLMKMLRNDYYGVRFYASNILKITGDKAYDSYISEIESHPDKALIYLADAVFGLSDDKFREIINILLKTGSIDKDIKANIIMDILNKKLAVTENDSLKKWIIKKINNLEASTNYNTR